jgi:hypothetical protein
MPYNNSRSRSSLNENKLVVWFSHKPKWKEGRLKTRHPRLKCNSTFRFILGQPAPLSLLQLEMVGRASLLWVPLHSAVKKETAAGVAPLPVIGGVL